MDWQAASRLGGNRTGIYLVDEGRAAYWESHGPGQGRRPTVATAIEKAADATERQPDHHARCDQIESGQHGKRMFANEPEHRDHAADERAVDHQAAFGKVQ